MIRSMIDPIQARQTNPTQSGSGYLKGYLGVHHPHKIHVLVVYLCWALLLLPP